MQVTFLCPDTKKAIESGIDIDTRTQQILHQHPVSVDCPHCGKNHEFRIRHSYESGSSS